MQSAAALHRLLGDDARLRMLRLLSRERLNVSELTAVLGIAQSGVSRHLGLLRDSGLVVEQREGGYTYYRAAGDAADAGDAGHQARSASAPCQNGFAASAQRPVWDLLRQQFAAAAGDSRVKADEARLKEVLRLRKESFATHGGERRQLVPGRSWAAWARVLGFLLPPLRVADLGCGEGYLTVEAARWASRVVAVDRSRDVLSRARDLAGRRGVRNIVWKKGDLERLPIADRSVDVALLSQALHHAADPARAVAEAVRILVPGGRLLVLDLRRHDEQWVRQRLGDRWLGFDDAELTRLLKDAGLADVRVRVGARLTGDPFTVLIATGERRNKEEGKRKNAPLAKSRSRASGLRRQAAGRDMAAGLKLGQRLKPEARSLTPGAQARPEA